MNPQANISAIVLAACLSVFISRGAVGGEDGKALAEEFCSACHQVTPEQARTPLVSNPDEGRPVRAPRFVDIAHQCEAAGDLRAKITNPHYPMREQVLTPVDTDALARYIRSLAPEAKCPIRLR